jgi:membrane protease YdiL (CAAX protease family)
MEHERKGIISRFAAELAEREASDRVFGVVLGMFFGLIALAPLRRGTPVRLWAVVLAGLLLAIAWIRPILLRGPKRAWLFLGFVIGLVAGPIVLAILFYVVITPIGFLMRAAGKDPLNLRAHPERNSYWRLRTAEASNMRDQF